jgi:hypothetical protein
MNDFVYNRGDVVWFPLAIEGKTGIAKGKITARTYTDSSFGECNVYTLQIVNLRSTGKTISGISEDLIFQDPVLGWKVLYE